MFSENDLCNEFIELLSGTEFRVFPEYEGWDFVLVRGKIRIGVQAKLKLNAKAVSQTLLADGVDFKIILTDKYPLRLVDDWVIISKRLKILIISKNKDGFFLMNDYWNLGNSRDSHWLFKWRHKNKNPLSVPDFDYETEAGVRSPRRVTERNINLVRLEYFSKAQPGGWVTLAQIRSFGFYRVPRQYFYYSLSKKMWHLQEYEKFWPSVDYPHIAAGLQKELNNDLQK